MSIPNNDCRNCGHCHWTVSVMISAPKDFSNAVVLETCNYAMSSPKKFQCSCHEFIPLDNLDYLEYKLKEKEISI